MLKPRPDYLLDLIRQAADLDFGLLLETDNLDTLRGALYNAIKLEGLTSEDLDIQITTTPNPNILYILRRSAALPE